MKKPLSPTQHRELIEYICAAAQKSGHRELARETLGADDQHILCLSLVAAYLNNEMHSGGAGHYFVERFGLDREDVMTAFGIVILTATGGRPVGVLEVTIDKVPEDQ